MILSEVTVIVEFLSDLTLRLKEEIHGLFLTDLDVSKEIQVGASGDKTTLIDKYAEDHIIKALSQRFKCRILTEEAGFLNFGDGKLSFIVDPIDASNNAKRKLPPFSTSIALLEDGQVQIGLVRDLYNGDLYHAIKGKGAYLNGKRVHTQSFNNVRETMLLFGRPLTSKDRELYNKIFSRCGSYRVLGCPSLELCYVASGKAGAVVEVHEKPVNTMMDIAAGQLIVKEAEGNIFNRKGEEIPIIEDSNTKTNFLACSNKPEVKKAILNLIE